MKNERAFHNVSCPSDKASRSQFVLVLSALLLAAQFAEIYASEPSMGGLDPAALARTVTIYRDKYGVAHIDGPTDESVIFGFAYCQAEDYLWQIEESYVGGLGRASELNGEESYKADWNNRLFEIPRVACEDFEKLDPKSRGMCIAFTAGLNFYVEKNPESKLRLLERFEPWHLLAFGRNVLLQTVYQPPSDRSSSSVRNSNSSSASLVAESDPESDEADLIGSNAYAI